MNRLPLAALVLLLISSISTHADNVPGMNKQTEDMDQISEFNRLIWRWRRCVSRYEEVHGASKDGKPPEVCGEEPKPPK